MHHGKLRVTLVDDDRAFRRSIKHHIEKELLPYELICVENEVEALDEIGRTAFDVALLDYRYSIGSRLDDLGKIKDAVVCVFLTDSIDQQRVLLSKGFGAYSFFVKDSANLTFLSQTIDAALSEQRLEQERTQAELVQSKSRGMLAPIQGEEGQWSSEAIYRHLVQCMGEGLVIAKEDESIGFANSAAERIFGVKQGQLVNHNLSEFLDEEGQELVKSQTELRRQGKTSEYELKIRRLDGVLRDISCTISPALDDQGNFLYSIGLIRDITASKITQEALRANAERLKLHLNNTPLGVIEWNTDFEVTSWNNAAEQIFGYTPEEAIGKHAAGLLVPENVAEHVNKIWQDLLRQRGGKRSTNENFTKDGRTILCDWYNTPLVSKDGNAIGVASLVLDITDSWKAEVALLESEKRYRLLVEAMGQGLGVLDAKGFITYGNQQMWDFSGYASEEVIGRHILEFFDEENQAIMVEQMGKRAKGESNTFEIEWTVKDGRKVPTLMSPVQILDSEGKPAGVFAVVTDISERKKIEEALVLSKERYRSLVQNIGEGLIVADENDLITFANPSGERLLAAKSGSLIGRHLSEILDNDGSKKVHDLTAVRKKGITSTYELNMQRDDGEWRDFVITGTPFHEVDGSFQGGQGIIRDVTDNKRAERALVEAHETLEQKVVERTAELIEANKKLEAEVVERKKLELDLRQKQKMEAIGTLAGGIAHDFNNLLFAIAGNAELALDEIEEGKDASESLSSITAAAKRATDLVNQILAFARRSEKNRKLLRVRPIVKEVLKLMRSALPTTIEIVHDLGTNRLVIKADPTEIHQVVMNLCSNAGKAMMENGGTLAIDLARTDLDKHNVKQYSSLKPGPYLLLNVSDTGVGMSPAVVERIFEPFFTTKEIGLGTGMGLSVVHGIVEDLGGTVTVYSEIGLGSTFRVLLPLESTALPNQRRQAKSEIVGGTEHVLVVDDEPEVARMLERLLIGLGYEVSTYTSALEAHEVFLSAPEQYDLILTDQTMPEMTGSELAAKILEICSDQPIVLCSGFSETMPRDKAESVGISAYLDKPIKREELAVIIRRILDEDKQAGDDSP